MIADYMEKGFLDNIVDMFRHDRSLYSIIGDLLADERSRVRIGTVALVETLKEQEMDAVVSAIPSIAGALSDTNPTIRGDAAYLLGIIGHSDGIPYLQKALKDENPLVREAARDALEDIRRADQADVSTSSDGT
jgi:vesicle coat complex subunit